MFGSLIQTTAGPVAVDTFSWGSLVLRHDHSGFVRVIDVRF